MRTVEFALILLIILAVGPVYASEDKNALDYMPDSRFLSGWEATGNEMLMHGNEIGWLHGEELPLLMEFDLEWFATETYTNFDDEMTVEIYQFPSASDAYGYYALSPIPFMDLNPTPGVVVKPYDIPPPASIDTIRMIEDKFIEGYKDKYYFRIYLEEQALTTNLITIAVYLMATLPGTAVPADMISLLPVRNLVYGTEKYIRGTEGLDMLMMWNGDDIFGFDEYDWKAVAGEYRLGGGEYYLRIAVEYENSETCETAAGRLQEYFQDENWATELLSPTSDGRHPRGFSDDTYAAFWTEGSHLWLLWDLSDSSALHSAVQ